VRYAYLLYFPSKCVFSVHNRKIRTQADLDLRFNHAALDLTERGYDFRECDLAACFSAGRQSSHETCCGDLQFLILHVPVGPGSHDLKRTIDPILMSVRRCEIPYDEKGILVDGAKGQILIPVKITLTETHLSWLKSRLPLAVTGIEIGSPRDL